MFRRLTPAQVYIWQLLFLLLSTTWLWAPHLNHLISSRTSLISQYETVGQPYELWFRLGDVLGGILLSLAAVYYLKIAKLKALGGLLLVIGFGSMIDSLVSTSCHMSVNNCVEFTSISFYVHATETVITSLAIFGLSVYDFARRKRLLSGAFVCFEILYGLLFLSQLADQNHFNTLSQFIYQTLLVVWLAWLVRDWLGEQFAVRFKINPKIVLNLFAGWVFLNGLAAVLASFADIHLFGRLHALYFAGDTAWLAQHSVAVGVVMLYLSRQLVRGERRARQLLLAITGLETIKYSVVTPSPLLMALYLITFVILFGLRDYYDRGTIPRTLRVRFRDAFFMLGSLSLAASLAIIVLYRDRKLSDISSQSIDHFFDYTIGQNIVTRTHLKPALLAHTLTAFILVSIAVMLWIFFRPYRRSIAPLRNNSKIRHLIREYSNSSEDFFKLFPFDKQYFWNQSGDGFIAYKPSGSVAFALADPIAESSQKPELIEQFITWNKAAGFSTAFLPVEEKNKQLYEEANLNLLQIGSSALVNIEQFLKTTAQDKWWRWKKNRALKNSYSYGISQPPHSHNIMNQLRGVSNDWLQHPGRQERGFAQGYFDEGYLQQCLIHHLTDNSGRVIAFANQVPDLKPADTVTVDLIRFKAEADDAMPYLLHETIARLSENYKFFDLGFVPFTYSDQTLVKIVGALSTTRFSAKGLGQFKNKFDPDWRPVYLAYDGDLGDFAAVAVNVERAMKPDL